MLEPVLRFPEFSSQPVQNLHLADATTESTDRNGSGQATAQIMGVSKVEGIVPMEERIVGWLRSGIPITATLHTDVLEVEVP